MSIAMLIFQRVSTQIVFICKDFLDHQKNSNCIVSYKRFMPRTSRDEPSVIFTCFLSPTSRALSAASMPLASLLSVCSILVISCHPRMAAMVEASASTTSCATHVFTLLFTVFVPRMWWDLTTVIGSSWRLVFASNFGCDTTCHQDL